MKKYDDSGPCVLCGKPIGPTEDYCRENIHPANRPAGRAHDRCVCVCREWCLYAECPACANTANASACNAEFSDDRDAVERRGG